MNGNAAWTSHGGSDPPPGTSPPPGWPDGNSASASNRMRSDGLRMPPGSFHSAPPPGPLHPPPFVHLHQQQHQQHHRELAFDSLPVNGFGAFPHHQQQSPPHPFALGPMLSSSPLDSGGGHPYNMMGIGGVHGALPPPPLLHHAFPLAPQSFPMHQHHMGATERTRPLPQTDFGFMAPPPGLNNNSNNNSNSDSAFYRLQLQQQQQQQQHMHHHQQQQQQQQQQQSQQSSGLLPMQQQSQQSLAAALDLTQSMQQLQLEPHATSLSSAPTSDPFASWAATSSVRSPSTASTASSASTLRDEMNQQMAALYQRDAASPLQQHTPLAASGSALLELLTSSNSRQPFATSDNRETAFPELPDLSASLDRLGSSSNSTMRVPSHRPLHQQQQQQQQFAQHAQHAPQAFAGKNANGFPTTTSLHYRQPPVQQQRRSPLAASHLHPTSRSSTNSTNERETLPHSSNNRAPPPLTADAAAGSTIDVTPSLTKPNGNIKVQVALLADSCAAPHRILMVGLFRIGQPTNERPIFVKQVVIDTKLLQQRQFRMLHTRIAFRAPRSPGEFEFRVFESLRPVQRVGNNVDTIELTSIYSNVTLARSNRLKVTMEYATFIETLRTTFDRLRAGVASSDVSAVLSSLLAFQRLVDLVETAFLHGNVLFTDVVELCLELVALRPASVARQFVATDASPNPIESLHLTLRTVLNAIQSNAFVHELLADDVLERVQHWQRRCFCQVSGLFFPTHDDRTTFWHAAYGFAPPPPLADATVKGDTTSAATAAEAAAYPLIDDHVTRWIEREASQLIPDADLFRQSRQAIYDVVFANVVARLPIRATLDVFGSSANDFGTHASDMDMCLVLAPPPSSDGNAPIIAHDTKQRVLQLVVALLERQPHLFCDVDATRLSARIPIVMFRMVDTGACCDLSLENALALRNTALLRAYANADRRVRVLAYVLKRFVKRRRMNAPSDGTLSSYGYVLMLLHFLQRQNPPIVPVLQSLGPDWDGTTTSVTTTTTQLPSVRCRGPASAGSIGSTTGAASADSAGGTSGGGSTVETYFYDPFAAADPSQQLALLESFGARNTMSVGALLVGFFAYYGDRLDATRDVVSIRTASRLTKDAKRRTAQWRVHTRLSIEDPFEVAYDVAHVLKASRDKFIRLQFARAYALVMDAVTQRNDEKAAAIAERSSRSNSRDEQEAIEDEEKNAAADEDCVRRVMETVLAPVFDPPFLQPTSGNGNSTRSMMIGHGGDNDFDGGE